MRYTLQDIQRAWDAKDPALVELILQLAQQKEPTPKQPLRTGALTFESFLATIFSDAFRRKTPQAQRSYRLEQIKLLESEEAEVGLSDRQKLYQIILLLWSDDSEFARYTLLALIRRIPLQYGVWKALKHIYKAAETRNDFPLLGALSARFDSAQSSTISKATMAYMVRRAWRYLRRLGQTLPVCYPEAAIHYLAAYEEDTPWQNTWVNNHIFYHDSKKYSRNQFHYFSPSKSTIKNRAFGETWQRRPEPLLRLLEMARAEKIRKFACLALQQDFKIFLRDIELSWIIRLASLPTASIAIDEFVVWLLKNAPKLEQVAFKTLGLHDAVLLLLDSEAKEARHYACDYVRTHGRTTETPYLIRWANNASATVRELAKDLLSSRDPRKDVGLEAWGQLLATQYGHTLAAAMLLKHFGVKELSADWFQQRLLSHQRSAFQFARKHLLALHPLATLSNDYFLAIITAAEDQPTIARAVTFSLAQIEKIGIAQLSADTLQRLLLNPLTTRSLREWIDTERIKTTALPLDYYKALAFHPSWEQSPYMQTLQQSAAKWAKALTFDESLAEQVRSWLQDVRRITPSDLGFTWLMQLVNREEAHYHQFALDIMVKAFLPAAFATSSAAKTTEAPAQEEKTVDLASMSFVFTGKLNTMTRKEAQNKVTTANGKNSTTITAKLDYLVIGDEGSPFYGNGRKGSKQLKAEKLRAGGAALKIISETAFLQRLVGKQQEFSADDTEQGCEVLWQMATDPAKRDTPIARFALRYLRHHHPDIGLQETDRPVDPGAEIPADFLSFERFKPLLQESYLPLRQYALEVAHWEFARWSPKTEDLLQLCDAPQKDLSEFVHKALLAEDSIQNKRYRIDASQLPTAAVYSFCESKQAKTRELGMALITQYPKFQVPESLFCLTESPDRQLRALVVGILWSLYRHRETTRRGQPSTEKTVQRPTSFPAQSTTLQKLLRRWLYELPPGRLSKHKLQSTVTPLSAGRAKKALIETFRDLALQDADFAQLILPLFETFMISRGKTEQAACLVAVTRIRQAHPLSATWTASL